MPTLFTRIINREIPGRFVYEDDLAVAFLSIAPVTPGHALVVPRAELDQWTDAPAGLLQHLTGVAQRVGVGAKAAFGAPRAGVLIAGMEVPHLHIHVFPAWTMADFDITGARQASDEDLAAAHAKLAAALA
ncbi:MAG TPA: HIT family protein [Trebonia sp.]|jgi:diadenosine tetraphosphate (Ap4A) HIT family hydrolase|nr:HIT family protein [Trebonia sp.]